MMEKKHKYPFQNLLIHPAVSSLLVGPLTEDTILRFFLLLIAYYYILFALYSKIYKNKLKIDIQHNVILL